MSYQQTLGDKFWLTIYEIFIRIVICVAFIIYIVMPITSMFASGCSKPLHKQASEQEVNLARMYWGHDCHSKLRPCFVYLAGTSHPFVHLKTHTGDEYQTDVTEGQVFDLIQQGECYRWSPCKLYVTPPKDEGLVIGAGAGWTFFYPIEEQRP